jgi:hypothetical protein
LDLPSRIHSPLAVVAALMGTGIVGWMDPFSFLVRSLGLSIVPATNYGLRAALSTLAWTLYLT